MREWAFAELHEFMEEGKYTNLKDALYDYLVEFYACAGFDDAFGEMYFSNSSEEELMNAFLSIYQD